MLCFTADVFLKVLIPSIAAGAVIGKGGETISQIQKDTGTNVKMSKGGDYYPGSTFYKFVKFPYGCKNK